MRDVGHRLLLSAVLWRVLRWLPDVLRLRTHVWDGRLLQPVHGRLRAWLRRIWTIRRSRLRRVVQPANRNLLARRRGVRTLWIALSRFGLQPTYGNGRSDTSRVECVRQLGHERCAAW